MKEGGQISVVPFGSAGTINYQGALTPLFLALHMRTGIFNRKVVNALITEGIVDFYWFSMMRANVSGWEFEGVDIIPGAGAGHLKELISWSIAWTDKYMVLLDSDEAGKTAFRSYEKFFGAGEISRFLMYSTPSGPENIKLEDFVSGVDKERILSITETKHMKTAITQLYFLNDDKQKEFFSGLNNTTLENLSVVKGQLKNWFQ